jgi:hypothetical protein
MPLRLLPHTVTVISPTITTGVYGEQVRTYGTTGTSIRAYVQPEGGSELNEARNAESLALQMFTVDSLAADDRVSWEGMTFDVIGPARRFDTPRGLHHYESSLRRVAG